jgi:DivIVA domain-containing protein
MSELTPLDILGADFPRGLRGFEPRAVRAFMQNVATAMEDLVRERGELRQAVHKMEAELKAFHDREEALREALVGAQKAAETTLESARSEGQRIVAEGHALADRLVEEAHGRAHNIEKVIADLRSRRREVRAELMRLAELLQGLIRDDQQLEKDERSTPQIALLHRRSDQRQA